MFLTNIILAIYLVLLVVAVWQLAGSSQKPPKIKLLGILYVTLLPVLGLMIFYGNRLANLLIGLDEQR